MSSKTFLFKPVELEHKENPLVFLDLKVGTERIGRVVIELFRHIVPLTVDNFYGLCTGKHGKSKLGKPLHYKGSYFHKIMPYFMCQGGDIVNFDGTSGYSIYGPQFTLENFLVSHKSPGILSMVTINEIYCNSQFIITNTDCPHLDGRSVAFGRVIRGFSCIQEMSQVKTANDVPQKACIIEDCGAFQLDRNLICQPDETGDALPHGPDDLCFPSPLTNKDLEAIIETIINSAKRNYKIKYFSKACRKFQKTLRYIEWSANHLNELGLLTGNDKELPLRLNDLLHKTHLNLSGCALELRNAEDCVKYCDKVLTVDKNNVKALYRKAKALRILKEYKDALSLLKQADLLQPNDSLIEREIRELRNCQSAYLVEEKKLFTKMFDFNK